MVELYAHTKRGHNTIIFADISVDFSIEALEPPNRFSDFNNTCTFNLFRAINIEIFFAECLVQAINDPS